MPNSFDEASKATEDMFEAEQMSLLDMPAEETPAEEVPAETPAETPAEEVPAEVPAEETPAEPTQEQSMLDEATQTAEIAAQTAAEKDAELQQVMQQLEALRAQNQQLQGAIEELSAQNEQNIIEEALEPPTLDIGSLAFADEETVKAAQAKYAADMTEYNRKSIMKELAPVIEQANEAKYNKEKDEVIAALAQVKELKGIDGMVPQLDKIIANNKALSSSDIPIDEKYITAYAIAVGVNSMNNPPAPPKELTADELMGLYNKNPEFQDLVEKQRLSQIKQHQQVPPFSASSGAVNAALNIPEEPKGWEDASERTRQMFGRG